jgi:pimeloyl-ACP methyl ester carboxylesterase
VVALLECEDLHDVVLVGHSSSGAVITGVAQQVPERIATLWYLDAFVPARGQSVLDLLGAQRRAHFESLVRNGSVVLEPDSAMDGWAVRDPADRSWLRPLLCPHPFGGLADPLPDRQVPPLPLTYVHCTDKPAGDSFAATAKAMQTDPAARVHVLDTGHDAMVTAPADVVRLLLVG